MRIQVQSGESENLKLLYCLWGGEISDNLCAARPIVNICVDEVWAVFCKIHWSWFDFAARNWKAVQQRKIRLDSLLKKWERRTGSICTLRQSLLCFYPAASPWFASQLCFFWRRLLRRAWEEHWALGAFHLKEAAVKEIDQACDHLWIRVLSEPGNLTKTICTEDRLG